jgi:hypothetical protein
LKIETQQALSKRDLDLKIDGPQLGLEFEEEIFVALRNFLNDKNVEDTIVICGFKDKVWKSRNYPNLFQLGGSSLI